MSASGVSVVGGGPSAYANPTGSPFALGNGGSTGTLDTTTLGRAVTLQVNANASSNTLVMEASDDGTNWTVVQLRLVSSGVNSGGFTFAPVAVGLYSAPVFGQYLRVRVSNFVGGTTTFILTFHSTPPESQAVSADTELPSAAALADGASNPTAPAVGAFGLLVAPADGTWDKARSTRGIADTNTGTGVPPYMAFNGATYDKVRTPNVVKTATATASGDTALWTPAAGKKFRLMRLYVQVSETATQAVGGDLTIALRDVTTAIGVTFTVTVPGVALTSAGALFNSGWIDLGNGVLSSAINQALNINLSAALATGLCRVVAIGTEE